MQVDILFYLDFNKESIYIEKMHCRRHAAQVLGCSYSLARDMLNLNSNDLNGLYRIFLNYMDFIQDLDDWIACVLNGPDAILWMASGDFPQVLGNFKLAFFSVRPSLNWHIAWFVKVGVFFLDFNQESTKIEK